jgi:hypothetical protein
MQFIPLVFVRRHLATTCTHKPQHPMLGIHRSTDHKRSATRDDQHADNAKRVEETALDIRMSLI